MDPIVTTLRRGPEVMALVAGFVRALPELARAVADATAHGDLAEAGHLAHRLKGTAAGYGFPELREHAAAIERLAAAGETDACRTAAADLVGLAGRVRVGGE